MSKTTETIMGRIWLAIATGGRWTMVDVREEFPDLNRRAIQNAVKRLSDGGYIARHSRATYGVTGDCLVPLGLKVNGVLEALTGGKQS